MDKTPQLTGENSRIPALDTLRGVAILMVAVSHFLPGYVLSGTASEVVNSMGPGGVLLFFLLSGYLIFRNLQRQPPQVFFMRRCFKLLPAYWVNVFVIAMMTAFIPDAPQYTAPAFVANVLMVPDVLRQPLVNPNYWTLVIEFRFYLLIALQYYLLSRRYMLAVPLAIVIANAVFLSFFGRGSVLLTYLPVFYIGIEILRAETSGWSRPSVIRLASVTFVVAASIIPFTYDHWPISDAIYVAVLPVLFVAVLRIGWNQLWLGFLGRISYSFYLFHAWVVGYALYHYLERTSMPLWLQVPLVFGTSLAVAYLSFNWIEKPGVDFGRWLEPKWLPERMRPATASSGSRP